MPHTTDDRPSPTRVARSPRHEGAASVVCGLLAVSAFLGLVVVPGGQLLALLVIAGACGLALLVLLSVARSLIRRSVAATADGIDRRHGAEPGRVADSTGPSSPSFRRDPQARSEV